MPEATVPMIKDYLVYDFKADLKRYSLALAPMFR
jgi:hypothetical protein